MKIQTEPLAHRSVKYYRLLTRWTDDEQLYTETHKNTEL